MTRVALETAIDARKVYTHLHMSRYIERPTTAARASRHSSGVACLLSNDERRSTGSGRLRVKFPDGPGRRIAQFDARRRQSLADAVGQLPLLRRAQLGPQGDARLHQRGQHLARIAEAERCRFAEA